MSCKIILLEPVLMEKIWGGTKLEEIYNYPIPSNKTGEAWVISAHRNGSSIIKNGKYQGKTLRWLYDNHRYYFGDIQSKEFPLLVKILDAQSDLSVQVHPNDDMALKYNDFGKTECWYILDSGSDGEIIYGHNAKSKEEFQNLIAENKWNQLLKTKKIVPGDFIYVPAGKVHAIKANTQILEIQQSSDVTFRLYDYDRLDDKGNKRPLHIEESILATLIPDLEVKNEIVSKQEGLNVYETLIKSKYFTVKRLIIKEDVELENPLFLLVSVLNGAGEIYGVGVKKGDNLVITSELNKFLVSGDLEIIVIHL